ncbi:transcriptional regulator [Kitasatospora sp. NPDC086801]|uniref:transcriptional regulator n=1 Tax=Kitasatospora sp. NPDC086801 TaxID=3364066 RepID=UPI003806E593
MDATTAATFAATFAALYAGHQVGDHWVQSSCQAADKGLKGSKGRWACTRHVLGLTATKAVLLVGAVLALGLHLSALGLVLGFAVDAGTHWWADRRVTLARLARVTNKSEFMSLGTPAHQHHPVDAKGLYAPTLGTGAYALDQSFHVLFLFVAALIIAAV